MKKSKRFLYADISGNEIGYQTYEFGQGKKILYIQGGIHGGEVTYFIFQELFELLKKNEDKLLGKIMLAPIINPPSWNQRIYYYTVGKFDLYKGVDWNRSYPGNDKTTLSARNSKKIIDCAQDYEYLIDLHTARISKPYTIFNADTLIDLIQCFGLEYNQFINMKESRYAKYKGIFPLHFLEKGKKSFICECGSHDSYEPENIEKVMQGIKNIISYIKLLDIPHEKKIKSGKYFEKIDLIYAPQSGFAQYHIQPQESFKKNQLLATIHSSADLGTHIEVRAPFDGVLFELPRSYIVWEGDELFRVLHTDDIKNL